MSRAKITTRQMAGADHAVVTVVGGDANHRREPCEQCPWRRDSKIGEFPAEAYRISANTSHDMSAHTFACHMSGSTKPAICAGFLLRGAGHNMGVRMKIISGTIDPRQVSDGGHPLYSNYREMAVANGVSPSDPALRNCRDDTKW